MIEPTISKELGRLLTALCGEAKEEILLVAPFVKEDALARLLEVASETARVRCVTRWHPYEIASGVSDLEAWGLLNERRRSSLWLRQELHAKLYRFDDQCLIGSANITRSALGWTETPNLELLLPFDAESPAIVAFEEALFCGAIEVNNGIYEAISAAVQLLPKTYAPRENLSLLNIGMPDKIIREGKESFSDRYWLPLLRHPADLFIAYEGTWDRLSIASRSAAAHDLASLEVPPGLDKRAFEAFVAAMVLQQPLVQEVDAFVARPQRFGAVKTHLANVAGKSSSYQAGQAWQTLMRWLLYFLPDRYTLTVPNYSEIFARKD